MQKNTFTNVYGCHLNESRVCLVTHVTYLSLTYDLTSNELLSRDGGFPQSWGTIVGNIQQHYLGYCILNTYARTQYAYVFVATSQ